MPDPTSTADTVRQRVVALPAGGASFDFRLLAVSAAGFCVFLSVYATQALLPALRNTFHSSEQRASATVTATTLAVALAAPFIGLLAERVGRKVIIVSAIFLLAIPTFGAATAKSLNALIAWRFAQGLIMPGIIAVTMAYVNEEWPPLQVGRAMSAYVTGNVLAGVVGRFMSGWVGQHYGWPASFLVLGAMDLVGGVIVLRGLPPSRRKEAVVHPPWSVALRDMFRHFENGPLLAAYAVGFNLLLVLVAVFTWITYRLAAAPFQLNSSRLGALFLVYLVGVVVTPLSGRFIDRFGQRNSLLTSLAVIAIGVLLTVPAWMPSIVLGLALTSSGIFICQSSTASYMGIVAGKARASAAGLYATFYYLGGATGSAAPGWFWADGGWNGTVVFLLIVVLLTAVIARVFWIKRDKLLLQRGESPTTLPLVDPLPATAISPAAATTHH